MRPILRPLRGAVPAIVAVVLLSACGSAGTAGSAPSASSSAPASAPSSNPSAAAEAGSPFCTDAADLLRSLVPAVTNQSDPAAATPVLQQAAARVRTIAPPADLAHDWSALADGFDRYSRALAALDQKDPRSVAAFQQTTTQIESELTPSATKVQTYLVNTCGLTPGSTAPSAPIG